jgi:hypothetical protein
VRNLLSCETGMRQQRAQRLPVVMLGRSLRLKNGCAQDDALPIQAASRSSPSDFIRSKVNVVGSIRVG